MASFDPSVVRAAIKSPLPLKEARKIDAKWDKEFNARKESWKKNRIHQHSSEPQLEFVAHIAAYIKRLWNDTHPRKGSLIAGMFQPLGQSVPLHGPRFVPPTFLDYQKRNSTPNITPEVMYLKPVIVLHPFFFPELGRCPRCRGTNIHWMGWTTSGYRDVHGVSFNEVALGCQLRCEDCEKLGEKTDKKRAARTQYCWSTTSAEYWELWKEYEIPMGVPHFFRRCALTRDLFNLLIELRLKSNATALAENFTQLHLQEYHKRRVAYYIAIQDRLIQAELSKTVADKFNPPTFLPFSEPFDTKGYNAKPISNDKISDVYKVFGERVRQPESDAYMRTLSGIVLSLDAVFGPAQKATLVSRDRRREDVMRGGVTSVINEHTETLAWRFCHSQANSELAEILEGIARRCEALGAPVPEMAVVDNCCKFRGAMVEAVPTLVVVLDVFHFKKRYFAGILNGIRNPFFKSVSKDIVDSILEECAKDGKPAKYRSKDEQVRRLEEMYERYAKKGSVWNAAAAKIHADQLQHARKGCLERVRQDLRADGSRIEGLNKCWNGLMRCFASGFENMRLLGHDLNHRRNIRMAPKVYAATDGRERRFAVSGFGTHHTSLLNYGNKLWNELLESENGRKTGIEYTYLPTLQIVDSGEEFGAVHSASATTFNGLFPIKEEEEEALLDAPLASGVVDAGHEDVLNEIASQLKIDPKDFDIPTSKKADADTPKASDAPNRARASNTSTNETSGQVTMGMRERPRAGISAPSGAAASAAKTPTPVTVAVTADGNSDSLGKRARELTTEEGTEDYWERPRKRQRELMAGMLLALREEEEESESEDGGDIDTDSLSGDLNTMTLALDIACTQHAEDAESREGNLVSAKDSKLRSCEVRETGGTPVLIDLTTTASDGCESSTGTATTGAAPDAFVAVSPEQAKTAACDKRAAGDLPLIAAATSQHDTDARASSAAPSTKDTEGTQDDSRSCGVAEGDLAAGSRVSIVGTDTAGTSATSAGSSQLGIVELFKRQPSFRLKELTAKCPLPTSVAIPDGKALTRSQALFSRLTKLDARALTIDGGPEFFEFMTLRKDMQLASFSMNTAKWASTTGVYNERLRKKCPGKVPKHPRALMDKLEWVEKEVVRRKAHNDYESKSNPGSTKFWSEHCDAVPLGDNTNTSVRAKGTCQQCKTIMHPGQKGSPLNHRRDYCADGVPRHMRDVPFPQPDGVFTKGAEFNVLGFLSAVRSVYQHMCIEQRPRAELTLEDDSFVALLQQRTHDDSAGESGTVSFRLFPSDMLKVAGLPSQEGFILDFNGEKHLKLSCL